MSDEQQKLTDVQRSIQSDVDAGKKSAAKAKLSRSWREAVPEVPQRFSVVLVRINPEAAAAVLARIKKNGGKKPPLKIEETSEGLAVTTSRGEKLRLGFLPQSESKLLKDLGAGADLYKPRLLEVKRGEGGVRFVAVEFSRPEMVREHTPIQIHEAVESLLEPEDIEDILD